ncbi:solute carrier family 9 subfamily C (Na+-transporting carboxylic acid decarboxylase) member 1 [Cricetulus griseus]
MVPKASYQRQYRNEILSQSAVQLLVGAAGSFVEKGEYFLLQACHKIVFADEFEYTGYLAVLMSVYPMIICWIARVNDIYEDEIKCANYYFLTFYILEALLKLITPKLLHIIDKRMSHQISFRYAILKGYVQGEIDVLNIIDHIASSKQAKQMLLKRVTRNMERAMKELGYLEYDHPEIAVTMKTKEEINVMLNMAREIVKAFRSKGIIHKMEGTEINKEKARIVTFDCGNNIFEEGDEPEGIYVIISGMVKLKRSKPQLETERVPSESDIKSFPAAYTEYLLSGEIIGELNCLTDERMQYSATCKTVVETYFIPISHLYEGFEKRCPALRHKIWQKIGLAITAQKIREHLPFEEWNYKMQLKLCNVFIRDIPMNTKTDIYDETVTHVILIHGSAEDCQLRKIYKAPFLIPVTCHQDNASQIYTEELCYVLVDHKALGGRPSGNSVEEFYENIPSKAERHRASSRGAETEYSVLRFPSTPQTPPSAEDEYELLVPSRLSCHTPQQPWPLRAPFETHFAHLQ